ncbi:MAG: hypothetical protein A4E28_00237 [Methanocella sp. PtaU1.Bin125]|nr:MAG: hypothetical protein A4E28_00237 [Methanocella sp. PtaU1.Bin125]
MTGNRNIIVIGAVIVVLLLIALGAYVVLNNGDDRGISTVDVSVNVGVRVMDLANDRPVTGACVYFAACAPDGTSDRDVHAEDLTGDDGWAVFSVNYTLDENQTIYLAASNRKPLLESDFAGRAFNGTGYLGEWKAFNYSVLYNKEDHKALVSCMFAVDMDSGRMI